MAAVNGSDVIFLRSLHNLATPILPFVVGRCGTREHDTLVPLERFEAALSRRRVQFAVVLQTRRRVITTKGPPAFRPPAATCSPTVIPREFNTATIYVVTRACYCEAVR